MNVCMMYVYTSMGGVCMPAIKILLLLLLFKKFVPLPGYQFWSLFCAIAPLIWFYPLNELELSGYEAFAIVLFSPALLGAPPLRRAVIGGGRAWPLAAFRLVALASLASFRAAGTLPRLVALCAGCFAVMIVLTATLWSRSPRQRYGTALRLRSSRDGRLGSECSRGRVHLNCFLK